MVRGCDKIRPVHASILLTFNVAEIEACTGLILSHPVGNWKCSLSHETYHNMPEYFLPQGDPIYAILHTRTVRI